MKTGGKTPHPPFATRGRFKQGNILVYRSVSAPKMQILLAFLREEGGRRKPDERSPRVDENLYHDLFAYKFQILQKQI